MHFYQLNIHEVLRYCKHSEFYGSIVYTKKLVNYLLIMAQAFDNFASFFYRYQELCA